MDVISAIVISVLALCCQTVQGGICWLSRGKNGRCRHVYSLSMSRHNCCSLPFPATSWSPHENVTRADIFYWVAFTGGAPRCHTCHESCKNVKCGPDRKCRVRRGQARCVCSPYCPRYKKLLGAVCGSDRQTYRNYCAMLRHNCRKNKETKISYFGRCKESCSDVKCYNPSHHCLTDQHGLPHCVQCNTRCPYLPTANICGEDGKTYSSYCHLVAAICLKGEAIRIAYKGECRDDVDCSTLRCPVGYKCLVNATSGLPQCANCRVSCPSPGPPGGRLLCGSDEKTYRDYCQMQQAACDTGSVIKTAHIGRCRDNQGTKTKNIGTKTPSWSQVTNST